MRIIKLSSQEFETVDDVVEFFEEELLRRIPTGKFRFPPGWIAEDKLSVGEPILFSYQTTVMYSARAASRRLVNNDEYSNQYPFYFQVDMETVRPVDVSLRALEEQLHHIGKIRTIVQSQGWPTIEDSPRRTHKRSHFTKAYS